MVTHTIEELHELFKSGELDVKEYYKELFEEAKKQQERLNAFVTITEEEAKKEADATSSKIEQVEPVADAPKQWIKFQAYMTVEQAKGLGQYMKSAGIEYKAL